MKTIVQNKNAENESLQLTKIHVQLSPKSFGQCLQKHYLVLFNYSYKYMYIHIRCSDDVVKKDYQKILV